MLQKLKEDKVEMLQIFVRPNETDLSPQIQFHNKPVDNSDWYVMVGPEGSATLCLLDAHPKGGEALEMTMYDAFKPFLYVMKSAITMQNYIIGKQEALTDLVNPLPPLVANEDATIVLFFVDMNAPMSMDGTISGLKK